MMMLLKISHPVRAVWQERQRGAGGEVGAEEEAEAEAGALAQEPVGQQQLGTKRRDD